MSRTDLADQVLSAPTPQKVADAAEKIAGQALREIESSVPDALAGKRAQVHAYVEAYRLLGSRVLEEVDRARPDLLRFDESHNLILMAERKDSKSEDRSVRWLKAALDQEAMSAPFSEWVGTLGVGRGTAVALVARLRRMLAGTEPLAAPRERHLPTWTLSNEDALRFYRAVGDELARVQTPLQRIASTLGVSRTELARLLGVTRQAIEQWELRGVPGDRQERLATLDAIVDLLTVRLKPDRIPGAVRRPAAAYGGRSMLGAMADGDEQLVLEELREAFDWSAAA